MKLIYWVIISSQKANLRKTIKCRRGKKQDKNMRDIYPYGRQSLGIQFKSSRSSKKKNRYPLALSKENSLEKNNIDLLSEWFYCETGIINQ